MRPEGESKNHLTTTLILTGIGLLSIGAFSIGTRRKIGERDDWECQDEKCNRSFKNGWMVTAAHFDHSKTNGEYDAEDNGRILCIYHHALEELARGNVWGAKKLLAMGLYTREEAQRLGGNIYLTVDDLV